MKKTFFAFAVLSTILAFSQSVEEIVKNYNQAIDPTGKLGKITHLQVDTYQIIHSPSKMVYQYDTTTSYYSIYGENSVIKWKDGTKIDLNRMVNVSNWERKNIIKNHLNYLTCDEDESFELVESTDSTYMVKIYSLDREVFYEIDRKTYDLKKKVIKYKGKEMTTMLHDYTMFDDIKVATRLTFQNEIAGAEMVKFNYVFRVVETE